MKRTACWTLGALVGFLTVGAPVAFGSDYAQRIRPTAYAYSLLEETASSDTVVVPRHENQATSRAYAACCDPCAVCCDPCEPWKLFPRGLMGLDVDMWLQTGGYANAYGEAVTPQWSTVQYNEWVLNQLWLSVGKKTDTGGCGFDIGGQMDFLFGTDARLTQGFGAPGTWDTTWQGNNNNPNGPDRYGWAMPQLYAEIALNNWTVKGGHFYTLMGYDVVQAPQNFFYSHGYNWYFGEPFTHTGVTATYGGFQNLEVTMGWTAGWDTGFANLNNASMLLGSVSTQLNDCVSVGYAINAGRWGNDLGDLYSHTILLQVDLTERLHWVLQNNLAVNYNRPEEAANTKWGGINNLLIYDINSCWGLGNRIEWFDDVDGARTGLAGDYWNYTVGLNYKPWANITIRPELRYDWYTGQESPFNGGTRKDQFGGGCDLIVTW